MFGHVKEKFEWTGDVTVLDAVIEMGQTRRIPAHSARDCGPRPR